MGAETLVIAGAAVFVGWLAICAVAAFSSGWLGWAKVYRCDEEPQGGDFLASHSIGFRPPILFTQYPFALRVGASAQGLHLRTNFTFPFFHKPLRIPWDDLTVTEKNLLFFRIHVLEFSGAPGARLVLRSAAWTSLRRKARLYWNPADAAALDPAHTTAGPSAFDGPASGSDEIDSPWATADSVLRLPDHGGVIGPAPIDSGGALELTGMPGRLMAGAAVALVVVATLNVIGVLGGDETSSGDVEQTQLMAEIDNLRAELESQSNTNESPLEIPGVANGGSSASLAESDDACPGESFPTGDRFPAGREIYCIHSEEALRHGPFVAWHESGVVKAQGAYRLGLRHGRWLKYDEQGQVRVEAEFVGDRMHGVTRAYASDGSLTSETHWQYGTRM